MASRLICQFPGSSFVQVDTVGGKALSLIKMTDAGLPVPSGAVLTNEFFKPWFEIIRETATWRALRQAKREEWPELCDQLARRGLSLPFSDTQKAGMQHVRQTFNGLELPSSFAVRSSSPEEDLASASFAGLYESFLGVSSDGLEDAVRKCFISSFSERILVYKRTNGLDPFSPTLAVIVQQQVNSDVAGIGFSLSPVTNDYDEVVIEANWGLGESVVDGSVSPDYFVVDKVSRDVVEKRLGKKTSSTWLAVDGGTTKRTNYLSDDFSLTEAQLQQLTDLICSVEQLYERSMDVEWAFAGGQLFILQARPITRYIPLTSSMMTKPGERRRLYADAALSKGMTTNAPISPLECDWGAQVLGSVMGDSFGIDPTPEDGLVFYAGNRLYLNLSNFFWLGSPARMAKANAPNDPVMARILEGIDATKYRSIPRPRWMKLGMLWSLTKLLWWLKLPFWNTLMIFLAPEKAHRNYLRSVGAYEAELREEADFGLALSAFRKTYGKQIWQHVFSHSMPALGASLMSIAVVKLLAGSKQENQELAQAFEVGSSDNVVVQMGIAMNRLARILDATEFEDIDLLAERIEKRQLPGEFLLAWDDFVSKYGWRGPLEMDVANPRYADRPQLALWQMSMMDADETGFDPEKKHKQLVAKRQDAGEVLMGRFGWVRRTLLRRAIQIIDLFGGSRDMPKHQLALFGFVVRKRALMEGERLLREGRLDSDTDVFALTAADLDVAEADLSLDLRQRRDERIGFVRELEIHVSRFPQVIDSRGRILRPPPQNEQPGQLSGLAVSPGAVRGPVKVLHSPHDQVICKGDVLVAYTTDPGWTPLFISASAIVLEVGGMLQHGAVVAREYGKPCVSGIERATSRLQNGQIVEVDGTEGIVRILS